MSLPALTGGAGWIARPVELPGSRPLRFEAGNDIALALRAWPSEHVAKCLVSYHPDDDATLRDEQLASLQALQAACIATDRELLIEVIPPRELASDDDTLARALDADLRRRHPARLVEAAAAGERRRLAAHRRRDRAPRSASAAASSCSAWRRARTRSRRASRIAAPHPICKGFAVGRSIFGEAAATGSPDDQRRSGHRRGRRAATRA